MKHPALVNYGPEPQNVELRELDAPELGPEDVLVEVQAVGVCGSEIHQWQGSHSWPVRYPVVLGHEFSGRIQNTGSAVERWTAGDRVVSETAAIIDPSNPMTRQGYYNLDPNRWGFGVGVDGAMTRFVRVPARCLHRIADELPFEKAALTEPCCVAYNAVVEHSPIQPGNRVVILGPGTIGLLCSAMAKLHGAEVAVVGLESDRSRLAIAEQFGCQGIVGFDESLDAFVLGGDGLGVDGVVDAAGVSSALKTALRIVRPRGWITKVGWGRDPLDFSLDPLVQKDITLRGSFSHNWPIWEKVIALLESDRLQIDPLIGGVWEIDQWETAFEAMHSGQIAKAILKP